MRAGTSTTATVTLVYPQFFDNGYRGNDGPGHFLFDNLSVVAPMQPGIDARVSEVSAAACTPAEVPAAFVGRHPTFFCRVYRLDVTAVSDSLVTRSLTLSAQWTGAASFGSGLQKRVIERVANFNVFSADSVGFALAVGAAAGGSYATRTTLPVSITQLGTGSVPVTLSFDPRGSFGLTGTFSPNPTTGAAADLLLEIPARYAEGGLLPLRLHGRGAGIDIDQDFTLRIEPLFTMQITPAIGSVSSDAPLDVQIDLTFSDTGPFASAPPALTLSHALLPPGTSAQYFPDATPTAFTSGRTVSRRLRITSESAEAVSGALAITATATALPPDLAAQRPFVTRNLDLTILGAPQWEYVENGASYMLTDNDTIGIALQNGDGRPAIAWLEGIPAVAAVLATPTTPARAARAGNRKAYVKRFDGAVFAPSPAPGPANALVAPGTDIDEARFALTRADVAKLAFTWDDGTGIALGSAGTSWTTDRIFVPGMPLRVRSPRIAVGAVAGSDVVALSYTVQAEAPATTSELFVSRAIGPAGFAVLPGLLPGGALNRDPAGRVLRGTPALALRPDGNPVAAWVEEPAGPGPGPAAALWVRAYDGAAWGPALAVPSSRLGALVAAPVQLAVEADGTVVLAWLEGAPARLLVGRCDLASQSCTALGNAGNSEGAINHSSAEAVHDFSLALDRLGRIVVAWTEGGVRPQLRVTRRSADATWSQLGPVVDANVTRTPHVVADANAFLYVDYTRFLFLNQDLLTPVPITDIFVVRWQHP